MVGLKTFWILISALFLFGACVPQTKQTECGSNEAFNSSLRTCVPVVQGPDAFILINSYTPLYAVTAYKADVDPIEFKIVVSNPYGQAYTIEWERVFNGLPVAIGTNSTSYIQYPALLASEIGTHLITAKIKNSKGTVVDTHSFQLKINDQPKPTINTTTLSPSSYVLDVYPTDAPVAFSFTVKNNNADNAILMATSIKWTVSKNGAAHYSETDGFTNFTGTGSNNAYLGTTPTPYFDPSVLGVGNYIIRAVVENTFPGEVVDSFQWNVNIKQPDLANVTTIAQPAPGVTIVAHDGVSYNQYPTYSWIHSPGTTKPNFCVSIDDRDGTYSGDGKSIQVRFYLNSLGGDICTKKTLDTPGTQTICLIDTNNCDPDGANVPFDDTILKFTNASTTAPQIHKVTARLFDEATTLEFQRSDVIPSSGSYPIEWIVNNKPVNTAPAMTFGSVNPTGCSSAGAYTRTNCQVSQGTNFTVSFVVNDDFYSPIANAAEFLWDVRLKYNGSDISSPPTNTTCTKAFGTAVTVPAASGPYGTQWTCTMAVPHFVSTGPLNPSVGSYSVVASMQDSGSPVGGAGLVSQSLTWNLVVTETNPTTIALNPQTGLLADSHVALGGVVLDPNDTNSYATELNTVTFRLNVGDTELDDFKYRISLCTSNTPTTCYSSTPITSPSYITFLRALQPVPTANPTLVSALLYTLPEDLLLQVSPQLDVNLTTSAKVYFKVDVVDIPSVPLTPITTDSETFSFYVRNYNPAPVVNSAAASPAVGSTSVVYSGMPITIDPGTVTDASGPASEKTIQYQWYSKIGAGAWTAITGATAEIIKYTPGNITSNIDLKLCVGDRAAANPVSSTGSCSGTWTITPKKYLEDLSANNLAAGTSIVNETAIWYDDTNVAPNTQVIYSAYVDSQQYIYVEKTIKDTAGNVVLSTQTIKFYALQSSTAPIVSNLSISGTADSVYIAYLASEFATPSVLKARVRRINKDYDITATPRPKTGLSHPAPFGFSYTQYALTNGVPACAACTYTPSAGNGADSKIKFSSAIVAGQKFVINNTTFTASANPIGAADICDNTVCADNNSTATALANKINSSTLVDLQGISAIVDPTDPARVLLLNQEWGDAWDSPIVANPNGLGNIFVAGTYWNLPMIDKDEEGLVTMLYGAADTHLTLSGASAEVLTDMGKTALFDAKLNLAGELVFASVSAELADAGSLFLYRYTYANPGWTLFDHAGSVSPSDQSAVQIFNSYSFQSVKLATDATANSYFYVLAKEQTINGGEYHIGRYNIDLDTAITPYENFLSTRVYTTDSTDDVITDSKMRSPEIVSVPGFAEARIFFHSVGTGAVNYPRVARWRADDTVSCGSCDSLTGNVEVLGSSRIGISQIANNITLGAAGAVVGENVRDLVFTLFSSDTPNTDTFKPQLGIINVEPVAIQSTTVEATGMWRPPFVLD